MSLFRRIARTDHPTIAFVLDGVPREGRHGDTLLTAILQVSELVRRTEFSQAPRAGFCLMGACQDCWVALESGERVRACSTPLAPGMRVVTGTRQAAR